MEDDKVRKIIETQFSSIYNSVFDTEENIKACGRETCRELIRVANKLEPGVVHGELQTGFMDSKTIIRLHNKLNSKT